MKPSPFEYHDPSTVSEVTTLLDDYGHEAELMAGNQSLGIIMSNRLATPDHIIDLNGVESLAGVDIDDERVHVGAMTRHRTLERHDDLRRVLPMLPDAAEQIAGPSVRNRGTVGGSVGEADPAGNYPTVLQALDGRIHVASSGDERVIPAGEFFVSYMFTDLEPGEVITGVSISRDPFPVERTGMAFLELKRAAQTYPTVSAGGAVRVDDPTAAEPVVESAHLALAAVADVPLAVPEAVGAVEGTTLPEEALETVATTVSDATDPEGELHADRAFKEEVAGEYARRALETAYERAVDGS